MIEQTRNLKSNFLMHKTIPYTYELELDILKIYLRTKSELSSSRLLKVRELRSENTHRKRDREMRPNVLQQPHSQVVKEIVISTFCGGSGRVIILLNTHE